MRILVPALLLAAAAPASARDLPVPPDKSWKHATTGLILPASLDGLRRTALSDATPSEHDVTAQFASADGTVEAAIFLFRPAVADAGLWFDRARTALETRAPFRDAAPTTAAPVGFAPSGAGVPTALRQGYASPDGPFRSTAVAVVPLGDWIVTVRISARRLTADQLDARLLRTVGAVRWPASSSSGPAATPIRACATPLAFKEAKAAKPDGADALLSLLGGTLVGGRPASPAAAPAVRETWCRDGDGRTEYGVYRAAERGRGYVLALFDAGRVVSVQPSIMGQLNKTGTYSVSLEDVDGSVSSFPSFAAMPSPAQVWRLVAAGRRTGRAKGNQVTIDSKSL